jgi:DNA invertase Pin-like site-specific DNA recombinase
MPGQVALYARVSTQDQNCEVQLRELREFVARHRWGRCTANTWMPDSVALRLAARR